MAKMWGMVAVKIAAEINIDHILSLAVNDPVAATGVESEAALEAEEGVVNLMSIAKS